MRLNSVNERTVRMLRSRACAFCRWRVKFSALTLPVLGVRRIPPTCSQTAPPPPPRAYVEDVLPVRPWPVSFHVPSSSRFTRNSATLYCVTSSVQLLTFRSLYGTVHRRVHNGRSHVPAQPSLIPFTFIPFSIPSMPRFDKYSFPSGTNRN
jgi:hypothetical protein